MSEFVRKNIQIDEIDGKSIYIRTIICGHQNQNKPKLVMLFGFGAASPFFYSYLGPLMDRFCVILHDIIGTGASSLPYKYIYPDDSTDYFNEMIEKWRMAMENEFHD